MRTRVREWLRPPRRLRVLRPGGFIVGGTFALGLATLNTGNNLLYLLMGALLGTIALSGWLSEQALRGVSVVRHAPRPVTAGEVARLTYEVVNRKRRLPSHGLELREIVSGRVPVPGNPAFAVAGKPAFATSGTAAFAAVLEPGSNVRVRGELHPERRGVYRLEGLVLATSFPFGLFSKERDLALPATLIVRPRTDRPVRLPLTAGPRGERRQGVPGLMTGAERGEYRGLREFRSGDDPRDVHWRTSARRGEPVVRTYDRQAADEYWIVLDLYAPDERTGEVAVEIAAALAAAATGRQERFGLAAGTVRVQPGPAAGRLDDALDLLAGVIMSADAPLPTAPAPAARCVVVSARAVPGAVPWGDVYAVPMEVAS